MEEEELLLLRETARRLSSTRRSATPGSHARAGGTHTGRGHAHAPGSRVMSTGRGHAQAGVTCTGCGYAHTPGSHARAGVTHTGWGHTHRSGSRTHTGVTRTCSCHARLLTADIPSPSALCLTTRNKQHVENYNLSLRPLSFELGLYRSFLTRRLGGRISRAGSMAKLRHVHML